MSRWNSVLHATVMISGLAGGVAWAVPPDLPRVQVWSDVADGLAIGGYDPLAYWLAGAPREGRSQLEYMWAGAVWRFGNPGNRDAFARDPDAYAPRFGGHDVTALSEGKVVQGHPGIWAIHEKRLLLFANAVNKRLWQQDRDTVMAAALKGWPELSREIPPLDPNASGAGPAASRDPAFALQLLPSAKAHAMKPGLSKPREALP